MIEAQVLPRLPAVLVAENGFEVRKEGTRYIISPKVTDLAMAEGSEVVPALQLWVYDPAVGDYKRTRLQELIDNLPLGPTGETPEISIGTVDTVAYGQPATVTITGTPEAPVLNFEIPAGADGAGNMQKSDYQTALSVMGRSANTAGDPATIAAANDHEVLRRNGNAIGFGTVNTGGITNSAVTYAKIQNVSATDRLLGRSTAGAGVIEEITCTAQGRALLDDAAASDNRTTMGLGNVVTYNEATSAEFRNNTADRVLVSDTVWGAAAEVALTDAATIAVDFNSFINATVTLAGNRAMGNPTNELVGKSGRIRIKQDATGSRTLSYGTDWEFAGGTAPTLSTAANTEDMLYYDIVAADRIVASLVKDVK